MSSHLSGDALLAELFKANRSPACAVRRDGTIIAWNDGAEALYMVRSLTDGEYDALMEKKSLLPKTKFGDAFDPKHVESINRLSSL